MVSTVLALFWMGNRLNRLESDVRWLESDAIPQPCSNCLYKYENGRWFHYATVSEVPLSGESRGDISAKRSPRGVAEPSEATEARSEDVATLPLGVCPKFCTRCKTVLTAGICLQCDPFASEVEELSRRGCGSGKP